MQKFNITILLFLVFIKSTDLNLHTNFESKNDDTSSIIMDAQLMDVVFGRNIRKRREVASLTKIMTAYVLFDEIQKKKSLLKGQIIISKQAARQPPSKSRCAVGDKVFLDDAIKMIVLASCNDIVYAAADNIFLSYDEYIKRMNENAKLIGMHDSKFLNSSGLTKSGQFSTAYDIAILCSNLIQKHPDFMHYFGIKNFKHNNIVYSNHNKFIGSYLHDNIKYKISGLKTGFTNNAGYNIAILVDINGSNYIIVTLGHKTKQLRDEKVKQLVKKCLDFYSKNLNQSVDDIVIKIING